MPPAVRIPIHVSNELSQYQIRCFILVGVATGLSFLAAPYPRELWLQHIPTALYLIAIPLLTRRYRVSDFSATCLSIFMLMHIVGARYLYSNVPYDDWAKTILGYSITGRFEFERNHYDRVCHFAFGFLTLTAIWETYVRQMRASHWRAAFIAVLTVLALSAAYEMIEWGTTLVLAPQDAASFNGQQGDLWDAQKDMFGALLGACTGVALLLPLLRRKYTREG